MLMLTVQVLERFPEAREKWQKAFRYVLVDEYQDTNHAQYRLLQLLAEEHRNVFAVGDPDQCLVAGTQVTMADGTRRADRAGPRGRRGALVLRQRPLRCGAGARDARRAAADRDRDHDGVRPPVVSTPEHTHFAGFKVGRTPQLHMTYLMWKRGVGFRVGTSRTYTNGSAQPLPGRRCG